MLAEVLLQRVEVASGLVDIILGADDANAAGGLTEQRLSNDVGPVV